MVEAEELYLRVEDALAEVPYDRHFHDPQSEGGSRLVHTEVRAHAEDLGNQGTSTEIELDSMRAQDGSSGAVRVLLIDRNANGRLENGLDVRMHENGGAIIDSVASVAKVVDSIEPPALVTYVVRDQTISDINVTTTTGERVLDLGGDDSYNAQARRGAGLPSSGDTALSAEAPVELLAQSLRRIKHLGPSIPTIDAERRRMQELLRSFRGQGVDFGGTSLRYANAPRGNVQRA